MIAWIVETGDNLELPFVIVDKVGARVFAFDRHGVSKGSAPVLLGGARGDTSPPGIGQRRLRDIAQAERITPAGRFIAGLGNDLGEADILWVDYDSALSLHRVIPGKPEEQRLQRLATASTDDNRHFLRLHQRAGGVLRGRDPAVVQQDQRHRLHPARGEAADRGVRLAAEPAAANRAPRGLKREAQLLARASAIAFLSAS